MLIIVTIIPGQPVREEYWSVTFFLTLPFGVLSGFVIRVMLAQELESTPSSLILGGV